MQLTEDDVKQADILVSKILDSLERGEDVVIKARKKVEPMQGPFKLQGNGGIYEYRDNHLLLAQYADMGLAFNTLEQAKTAKPIIRRYARLLNWVLANCPGHDPSGSGSVLMFSGGGKWACLYVHNPGGLDITAPTDKAKELCELLNSGVYTL